MTCNWDTDVDKVALVWNTNEWNRIWTSCMNKLIFINCIMCLHKMMFIICLRLYYARNGENQNLQILSMNYVYATHEWNVYSIRDIIVLSFSISRWSYYISQCDAEVN